MLLHVTFLAVCTAVFNSAPVHALRTPRAPAYLDFATIETSAAGEQE